MQQSSIELKSTKYVLTLVMDPSVSFETILADVSDKFRRSARFFQGASMALAFSGRDLTAVQQRAVITAITEACRMEITCVIEEDPEKEEAQYSAISAALLAERAAEESGETVHDGIQGSPSSEEPADVIRGTVRNGQRLTSARSILLLGDVEPGGEVASEGSVFIAGCAMGSLRAGIGGRQDVFAAALILKPASLEVCGRRSVSAIRKRTMDDSYKPYPQVCTLENGHMKLDTISGRTWNHIFEKMSQAQDAQPSASDPEGEEDTCSGSTN
jgi:septum site-determining protein MinC